YFLGPFWITLSMAIFVAVISVVYSRLFHQDAVKYIPFLLCGFLNWTLISNIVNQSCRVYMDSTNFITQIKLPFFLYILKQISKEMVIYGHNLVVYLILIVIIRLNPGWIVLLAIPGLFLVLLNLAWVGTFLAMLSARYRDIPPVVSSLVQVCFFVSPITWMPKLIGDGSIIIKLNPVTYLLDVVRDPMLGILPPWYAWVILIGMFLVGSSLLFLFFGRYRARIPFWVL
ncbi:MAG: ABC transporter permease, partial [Gammaproteobacteria bacterium]|nr:ABC transporter permease [Gammaproteobacteria bacterium]